MLHPSLKNSTLFPVSCDVAFDTLGNLQAKSGTYSTLCLHCLTLYF